MEITLKQARRMKDISQSEMAKVLGVHVQTYRRIEKSPQTATVEQVKALCKKLEISYNDIFFGDESTLSRHSKADKKTA